jgi:hypothetical protein
MVARWISRLAPFHYTIVHRPGKWHTHADGLSRRKCRPCKRPDCPDCSLLTKVTTNIAYTYDSSEYEYDTSESEDDYPEFLHELVPLLPMTDAPGEKFTKQELPSYMTQNTVCEPWNFGTHQELWDQLPFSSEENQWSQKGRNNNISPTIQDPVILIACAKTDPLNKVIYNADPMEQVIVTDKSTILKPQDVNYRVQRTENSQPVIVHVDRLARYYSSTEIPTWLPAGNGEYVSSSTQTDSVLEQQTETLKRPLEPQVEPMVEPTVLRPFDSDAQDCDDRGTEPKSPKRLRATTGPRPPTRKKRDKRKATQPLRQSRRLNPEVGDSKHRKALVWAQPGNDRGRPPSSPKRSRRTRRAPDRLTY